MFTNRISSGDEDIESRSITEQVNNTTRNALPVEETLAEMEFVGDNDGNVEEIDKWVASLERILKDIPSYMCSQGHPGRISRIPENLREVDVKGYEPYILSIGPCHKDKPRVQDMEMKKKLVLKYVLQNNPGLGLKEYLEEIISMESTARSFYSDVDMDTEKFVRMLLLDSVYILAAFFGMPKPLERMNELSTRTESRVDNDDVTMGVIQPNGEEGTGNSKLMVAYELTDGMTTGINWFWGLFTHDLFLLENQIPFFVLQKMHNLTYGGSGTQFADIMKYEVANMVTDYTKQDLEKVIFRSEDVHHLLHLCHMFFHPAIQQEPPSSLLLESSEMFRLGSAVQLYEAGVHFEARSGSTISLLDIKFDGSGKLAMPCLLVDDNTESLLRNLIALEQMKYPSLGLNISAYIVLLLHLVTIPKDVELLRRKGIIQHHLASDKEMMYLVNRLSMGLAFDYVEDRYSLKHVFHELKQYSERRVPRWRAWLKHRHFSNPWTTISLLVAFILLLLTFVQTFYTVYAYYYPYFNGRS